jgi:hypothetical protein
MDRSPKWGLGYLSVGQAQKETVFNESILTLDSIVGATVEQPPLNDPPSSPPIGSSYIVGNTPTGDWEGKAQCLAAFTTGGWHFITPKDGLSVYVRSTDTSALYSAGEWNIGQLKGSSLVLGGLQVVGTRLASIASPSGGTVVDLEARTAVDAILAAMQQHGLIET